MLDHEVTNIRDETTFDRDGTTIDWKVVTFFLGKHGPFMERFRASEFTSGNVQARIQQLKTHLELLGAK